ncbi:MAG TPA: adenylate/guanylate cyclase domain-containing protein, partial [Gammaproteobacteria bacterium]
EADLRDAGRKQMLRSFIKVYQEGQNQYLNYYGPARSIKTIPYYKAISESAGLNDAPGDPDLHNKLVFVGSSEIKQWEQHDGFYSVYSNPQTGLDISGVEIAATATANLLEDSPVRPLSSLAIFLLVLAWGVCLGALCRLLSAGWATLGVFGVCVSYYWIAASQFATGGIWLPIVMPLLIQAPVILFAGVLWTYLDTSRERRNIQEAFGYYLPSKIVDRLIKEGPEFGKGGHLVYGICLYTDAEQYTRLSEQMDPKALGKLMNEYYHAIFAPVKRHEGIVSDVVGDSMLALWTSPHPKREFRVQACHAALELIQAQDQFNLANQNHPLPTRIGLHCGTMLLGNVGAIDHYEYRAVGDIVNTATRIQGVNKYFGTYLLISEEALSGVDGMLTREVGHFILMGKSKPVRLFEILCREEDANESLHNLCNEFTHALMAFRERCWDQAAREFTKIHETYNEDPASHFYLKLCAHYTKNPPAQGWDGVVNLQGK